MRHKNDYYKRYIKRDRHRSARWPGGGDRGAPIRGWQEGEKGEGEEESSQARAEAVLEQKNGHSCH